MCCAQSAPPRLQKDRFDGVMSNKQITMIAKFQIVVGSIMLVAAVIAVGFWTGAAVSKDLSDPMKMRAAGSLMFQARRGLEVLIAAFPWAAKALVVAVTLAVAAIGIASATWKAGWFPPLLLLFGVVPFWLFSGALGVGVTLTLGGIAAMVGGLQLREGLGLPIAGMETEGGCDAILSNGGPLSR
jgi:hypothetical protein